VSFAGCAGSIQSMAGDQRSGRPVGAGVRAHQSGLWTAIVYALTFLPALAGPLFAASPIADPPGGGGGCRWGRVCSVRCAAGARCG